MDEAFAGLSGYWRIVDDVIIYDSDTTQHEAHVCQFLQRCLEFKITLNQEKWEYAQLQVTFAGFQISQDGYSIDTAITNAISQCQTHIHKNCMLKA